MKKTYFIILCLCLIISFCSQTGDTENTSEKDTQKKVIDSKKIAEAKKDAEKRNQRFKTIKIKKIVFSPKEPITLDDLKVTPVLVIPQENVEFKYRWFVNEREIFEVQNNILPKENFKKSDWVSCWISAKKGDMESGIVKSNFIKISPSPPIIKPGMVEQITIPGNFSYKIDAIDPDTEDEEEKTLSFELVSPKDVGINLNSSTGEINWFIDESIIKRFGTSISIKFKVIKAEAGTLNSSITINFKKSENNIEL